MKRVVVTTSEPSTWNYCLTEEASARVKAYAERHSVSLTVAALALLLRGQLLLDGEDCEHSEMAEGSTFVECAEEMEIEIK